MKKALIAALIVANVGLLGWVLARTITPAQAQNFRGVADYIVVSGNYSKNNGATFVLDINKRRLSAWRYDPNRKRMVAFNGRDLARDFGRGRNER